jgi:hypothetical protein
VKTYRESRLQSDVDLRACLDLTNTP